jgi:hypothetical protein
MEKKKLINYTCNDDGLALIAATYSPFFIDTVMIEKKLYFFELRTFSITYYLTKESRHFYLI